MGKADVEEWVLASTVAPEESDDTENDGPGWDKDRILADWQEGVQIIRTNLSSSSTKARTEFLETVVIPLVKDESKFSIPAPYGDQKNSSFERSDGTAIVRDLYDFHSILPTLYRR